MNNKDISIISMALLMSFSSTANNEQAGDAEYESEASLQSGWCEFFYNRHWILHDEIKTKEACHALDTRFTEEKNAFTWQNKKRIDSKEGKCLINDSAADASEQYYDATQIGCENHDKNSFDSYHWKTEKPAIYTGEHHRGFSLSVTEDIPVLCQEGEMDRLCGLIKSYSLPIGWRFHFYEAPHFQGKEHIRSSDEIKDDMNFIEGHQIRSIKISKNTPPLGNETVTTASQIYFGERKPTEMESCGENGRILKKNEIENIGHTALCNEVRSPDAIWKIKDENGNDASFMGKSYQCEMKAGVNSWAPALCVMKTETPNNKAFLYKEKTFRGSKAWEGNADIKTTGDNVPDAYIHSFTLGSEAKLCTYPEPNYAGILKEYTISTAEPDLEIRSYKLKKTNEICD